jgi:MOSC domain-containing protein YiiM
MRLLSISVGLPMPHMIDGKQVTTGVFKWPAAGPVRIGRLGAAGDGQATQPNHGGPDQALSVYSFDHYRYWGERFNRDDLSHGIFGENLTVDHDMTEAKICIGDVFAIGGTIVQVTHPRIPCFRLSYRLGLPLFHDEQFDSGRIGYLLRVLNEGEITAGDAPVLIERDREPVTVAQCIAATLHGKPLPDVLKRLDDSPHLSAKLRTQVASQLAKYSAPAIL